MNNKRIQILMNAKKLSIVNIDPYTSELYSSLLEPAFESVQKRYVEYGNKKIQKQELFQRIIVSSIRGGIIGASRSIFTTAMRNMHKDYKSQDDPKLPIDIYFIQQYTHLKNYPKMLRGLDSNLKVECSYQIGKNVLSTLLKYYYYYPSNKFMTNLGLAFGRTYASTFLSSVTVYPTALKLFTDLNMEEIFTKSARKASIGSIKNSLISVGISIVRAVLPSYKKLVKYGFSLLSG